MNRNIKSETQAYIYMYEAAMDKHQVKHHFIHGNAKSKKHSFFEWQTQVERRRAERRG